jgi:hypothetical protein
MIRNTITIIAFGMLFTSWMLVGCTNHPGPPGGPSDEETSTMSKHFPLRFKAQYSDGMRGGTPWLKHLDSIPTVPLVDTTQNRVTYFRNNDADNQGPAGPSIYGYTDSEGTLFEFTSAIHLSDPEPVLWDMKVSYFEIKGQAGDYVAECVLLGKEEVTVPAGTFSCLKFDLSVFKDNEWHFSEELWLAEEVGVVKAINRLPLGAEGFTSVFAPEDSTQELEGYYATSKEKLSPDEEEIGYWWYLGRTRQDGLLAKYIEHWIGKNLDELLNLHWFEVPSDRANLGKVIGGVFEKYNDVLYLVPGEIFVTYDYAWCNVDTVIVRVNKSTGDIEWKHTREVWEFIKIEGEWKIIYP